jgi:hypothetical protein
VYTSSSLGFANSNATRIFSVTQMPPTVTVAPSTTSLSVTAGSSVTDTITITPMGGYSGTLQFSCTNLPQDATCSFQPPTVTLSGTSGPQTTVVTIQTAGSTAALGPKNNPVLLATVFWIPGLFAMGLAGKRRRLSARVYHSAILLALFAGISILAGCGGGGSSTQSTTPTAPSTPSAPVTPAGTSTVKIAAASSGTTVQSFTLTLTVQ